MDLDPAPKLPTLGEVLNGTASRPYSLDDFRLFLYYNHCSQTLNFLECAKMYYESFASAYIQLSCLSRNCSERPGVDLLLRHWQNLVSKFLLSGSPQEIDLLTEEQMGILIYRITAIPPPPYVLEHVVRRLYDQIEESMFPEFLFRDSGKE